MPAPDLPVRPGHLDHVETGVGQVPREGGSVAARALHSDRVHRPERAQPAQQPPVPGAGRREALGAEHAAEVIHRRRNMDLQVRVDAAGDETRLRCHRGHVRSSRRRARAGTVRSTSDRTGTGLLPQAPTRSLRRSSCQVDSRPADESARRRPRGASHYWSQTGRENHRHPTSLSLLAGRPLCTSHGAYQPASEVRDLPSQGAAGADPGVGPLVDMYQRSAAS